MKRCQETADAFCNECNLDFHVNEKLLDDDSNKSIPLFIQKLKNLLEELPDKSFLISHCNFIVNMAYLATGTTIDKKIHNCSITFIENCNIVHIGKI